MYTHQVPTKRICFETKKSVDNGPITTLTMSYSKTTIPHVQRRKSIRSQIIYLSLSFPRTSPRLGIAHPIITRVPHRCRIHTSTRITALIAFPVPTFRLPSKPSGTREEPGSSPAQGSTWLLPASRCRRAGIGSIHRVRERLRLALRLSWVEGDRESGRWA